MLELAGEFTFDSFSEHLGTLDTFPDYTPEQPVYRSYRRWGFESAALDLALRQAGTSLHELLGRTAEPVTFVVSSRMGEPPTIAPVARRLAVYPALRFKLDATPDWPRGADRRAAGDRRGRLDRLQGRLQGHRRRRRDRPGLLQAHRRVVPGRLARGPGPRDRGGAQRARVPPGPDHLGRADPLGRGHPQGAGDAAHGQPQAVALRQREGALRGLRVLRAARDGRLRRRPVRARRRPRARPAAGRAVSPERAQRHRSGRLRRARSRARPARQPARRRSRRRWASVAP